MVSDIVLEKELPEAVKNNISAYTSCISGAILKEDYINTIKGAGFIDIEILDEADFPIDYITGGDTAKIVKGAPEYSAAGKLQEVVLSIKVSAIKP